MGIYLEEHYVKDKYGKWKPTKTQIVKAPHGVSQWERSVEMDKAKDKKYNTYFMPVITKGGLNKKVAFVSSLVGDGLNEKVDRTLLTTSSKLSKKDKQKYKGIKGFDKPITR